MEDFSAEFPGNKSAHIKLVANDSLLQIGLEANHASWAKNEVQQLIEVLVRAEASMV